MKKLLSRAIEIAARAHVNQVDKSGNPYILHPLRVMNVMKTTEEKIVAVLHDTIEDTYLELEDLMQLKFPKEVIDALDALTHRKGESNKKYISRVCKNLLALRVKKEDVKDNHSRLDYLKDQKTITRLHKKYSLYKEALCQTTV